MTFYYDNRDFTYVQEDDGKIYYWKENGRGPLTDYIMPDPMEWHECTEKVANEHIKYLNQSLSF